MGGGEGKEGRKGRLYFSILIQLLLTGPLLDYKPVRPFRHARLEAVIIRRNHYHHLHRNKGESPQQTEPAHHPRDPAPGMATELAGGSRSQGVERWVAESQGGLGPYIPECRLHYPGIGASGWVVVEGVSSKWGPHTNSVVLLYFNLQLYYLKTSVFIFFLIHLSD